MTADVVSIKPASKARASKTAKMTAPSRKVSKAATIRRKYRHYLVYGGLSLIGLLMAVSIVDLAEGLTIITGRMWQGWALAVVVDAGLILSEGMMLVDEKRMAPTCKYYLYGTLLASAGLNVLAMTAHAEYMTAAWWMAATVGALVPAAYFQLSRIVWAAYRD